MASCRLASLPERWHRNGWISTELYCEHTGSMTDAEGNAVQSLTGVGMEDFHYQVARMVAKVDPTFRDGAVFIGRGRNARAIAVALNEWARSNEA